MSRSLDVIEAALQFAVHNGPPEEVAERDDSTVETWIKGRDEAIAVAREFLAIPPLPKYRDAAAAPVGAKGDLLKALEEIASYNADELRGWEEENAADAVEIAQKAVAEFKAYRVLKGKEEIAP